MFREESVKSSMTIENDFHGMRVVDGLMLPVYWSLTAHVVGIPDETLTEAENQVAITVAYQRLNFWLDSVLDNVVIADRNDDMTSKLFLCRLHNVIMHVPGDPSDDTIAQLLHAKLSALAGTSMLVGKIVLKGSDTRSTYIFCPESSDDYTQLPEVEDYVEDDPVYDSPWWHRRDLDVHDMAVPEGSTREEIIADLSTADLIDSFDKEMTEQMFPEYSEDITEDKDESPAWTPTIVE